MSPPSAVYPWWKSSLWVHGLLTSGCSLVADLHKVVLEHWVLVVGGWKKIHPRIVEALADNRKYADPSEEILLASVKPKELVETPQKDTLVAFYKVWPYRVLEVLDSMIWISQSITIEQWFVHSSVTSKTILE